MKTNVRFMTITAVTIASLLLVTDARGVICTYESTDVPKEIPDCDTVYSSLTVPDSMIIQDVDVVLNITHTYDADLDTHLIAPDGTIVNLFSCVGRSGDNFIETRLDDEASMSIVTSQPPFTGSYRPEGKLADFDGRNAQGIWQLKITDDCKLDTGVLISWRLIIEGRGAGRAVTILLTLSEPGKDDRAGPVNYMNTLLDNAVKWVGRGANNMKVLVIRDDNHGGEWTVDTDNIYDALIALGYNTILFNEPEDGIKDSDLLGYNVALLSNPGYPIDDVNTAQSLEKFFNEGGGVILQGDDLCHNMYAEVAAILHSMTRLDFVDNGSGYFGHPTDNMGGEFYLIEIVGEHPVISGLEGVSFSYGDDIDTTEPTHTNEVILAWATLEEHGPKPVIIAYEAPLTIEGLINYKEQQL